MTPDRSEEIAVILTAIAMCGGAGVLWLWSNRSNTALALIGGLWLVAALAGLVLGHPWDVGVMGATVLAVLLLLAVFYAAGGWRR